MDTPCTKAAYGNAYQADNWFECPDNSDGMRQDEYENTLTMGSQGSPCKYSTERDYYYCDGNLKCSKQSEEGICITLTATSKCAKEGEYSYRGLPCCDGLEPKGDVIASGTSFAGIKCVKKGSSGAGTPAVGTTRGASSSTQTRTPTLITTLSSGGRDASPTVNPSCIGETQTCSHYCGKNKWFYSNKKNYIMKNGFERNPSTCEIIPSVISYCGCSYQKEEGLIVSDMIEKGFNPQGQNVKYFNCKLLGYSQNKDKATNMCSTCGWGWDFLGSFADKPYCIISKNNENNDFSNKNFKISCCKNQL
jgi:hypothetical protein